MAGYADLQKTIFDFFYGAALGDATGQRAFEGNKKPLRNNEDAKKIVREYIDGILRGEEPDFYKTAEALEESFRVYIEKNKSDIEYEKKDGQLSNPVFCFGNAQKLINMVAKNIFLLVYRDENLRENFKQCHCPMDNIMIKIVKDELKKADNKEAGDLLKAYKESEQLAWSRIEKDNKEQYEKFQECVRFLAKEEELSPIEYDYWMWKKKSSASEGEKK